MASSTASSNDGTEPDSHNPLPGSLTPQQTGGDESTMHSPTNTHYEGSDVDGGATLRSRSHSQSRASGKEPAKGSQDRLISSDATETEDQPQHDAIDVSKDQDIDCGPFQFKPYFLASLVDPKNMDDLTSIGGVKGLLAGLGTSRKRGLGKKALVRVDHDASSHPGLIPENRNADERPHADADVRESSAGAGEGASQRHDRGTEEAGEAVPGIVVTGPGGDHGEEGDRGGGDDDGAKKHAMGDDVDEKLDGPAYEASLDERHRVYGENVLPSRKSKSLLQLMWLALKDKVLVRAFGIALPF